MPNVTENYGLKKPLPEEFYDVNVQNENMDIIDAALKTVSNNSSALDNHNTDASAHSALFNAKANKSDVETALAKKANSSAVYTKTEVDNALAPKANSSAVYTKTEVDNLLTPKANTTDVNTALEKKANVSSVYTKTEVDNTMATKANASDLSAKAPLASPTFTGTPKAPTASSGTNTTQIATTAFVQSAVAPALRMIRRTIADLEEGSTIQLKESGSPVDFYVAKHNYEGTGRTLMVRKTATYKTYYSSAQASANNKYENSNIDKYCKSTYFNSLDANVQAAIAEVPIEVTTYGAKTSYSINRTVFILSATEYRQSATNATVLGEPLVYAVRDSNRHLWTRTSENTGTSSAYILYDTGTIGAVSTTSDTYYVQPAFTLPADYEFSDEISIVANGEVVQLGAKVVTGSYTGNGTAKTLTFDSQPQLVVVRSNRNANYGDCGWLMLMRGCQTTTFSYATSSNQVVSVTWSGNSVTWQHTEATPGGTYSGTPYVYVAIIQ